MSMSATEQPNPSLAERIREARRQSGLTQEEVGKHLGVARTTIVAIERGERRVQPEELMKLAALFGRQVNDLLRASAPVEPLGVQFRLSLARAAEPKHLESAVTELERLAEDYLELERITRTPLPRHYPPLYAVDGLGIGQAAQEIAAQERNRLSLGDGPLLELRESLENDVGIRIFSTEMPGSVAALFGFNEQFGACIAINAKHPRERQNWSMAHEYGHFLTTRYRAEITALFAYQRVPEGERLADAFAAAFLMPPAGLTRRLNDLRRARSASPTPADLLRLAASYRVSFQAMVLRLEDLSLLSSGTWDRLEMGGFRVQEARELMSLPSDEPDREMLPLRYRYLAVEAYRQGLITEGQFAHFLRRDRLAAREEAQALSRSRELTDEGRPTDVEIDFGDAAGGS